MASRPPLRQRLSWRLEYVGYQFFVWLLQRLPFSAVDHLGCGVGWILFYASRHYRELAVRNLRIAYGSEKSLAEINTLARQTCQRTISNFMGSLKTTVIATEKVEQHVSFQGKEHLDSALSQGKGAILVLGHMGNWEILNRLHQFLPKGTPAGGIYQPLKNPLVNAHLLKCREQDGSHFFNKRDGFHAPASFVKQGGLLIVVADQRVGRAGISLPFFNRLSSLSPLPALLARKAGSPVIEAGIETIAPGQWQVVFRPLPPKPDTENIIQTLEELVRRSPADYLWLHNRWRLSRKFPLTMKSKESKTPYPDTTPLRILVITTRTPDSRLAEHLSEQGKGRNFPLSIEFLQIHSHQPTESESSSAHHHAIAPTGAQLAAQISTIDEEAPYPIEMLLVDTPTPEIALALHRSAVPDIRINDKELPLLDFALTLTKQQVPNAGTAPASPKDTAAPPA